MEKFTNPKRGNTRVGSICASRHVGPTTNEHILPFLLVVFLLFFVGNLLAQPFNQQLTTSNPLNGIDVGSRSVPVFVDIDNDCDKDLFVGTQAGEILFYLNKGTASVPSFVATTGSDNPMNGFTVSSNAKPAFVDIDADGDLDCFVGTGDGTITAYKNEGDVFSPNFVEQTGPNSVFFDGNPFDGEDVGANASPVFLDFDFDGDYDCFVGRSNGTNSIRYYRNEDSDYNPVFNELTGGSNPLSNALLGGVGTNGDITSNACLTAADFGNDGDLDIYVGVASGVFRYFRNNGSSFTHFGSGSSSSPLDNGGTPNPKDISASGTDYSSPTFVDIDGDGDLDCFSGRNPGTFVYYKNEALATARVITCIPTYVVNLNANGTVTVDPDQVDFEDLFVSTTFTCVNDLEFTVTGVGSMSFSCADADNTAILNGLPESSSLVLTATDAALNSASCTASITIVDKTPPVPNVSALPTQSIDICSVSNFPASYIPTATDACPTTTVSGVASPGSLPGSLGQTTVTWTYTDSHGNTSTQTQVFNVVSNTAPTWMNCPSDIGPLMENQGAPNCGYVGNLWTVPTTSDCEAIVSMNSSHTPTSFFPVGVTTVSYAAQDAGGNTGYCNFTVTVTDGIPPSVTVISGPRYPAPGNTEIMGTVNLNSTQGVCGAAFFWQAPNVSGTDNCGGNVSFTSSHPSGYTFPIGSTTVSFWATDAGGNSTTYWTFTVNVTDIQPPSLTCPVSITIPTAPNSCTSASVNLTLPNATDNCPGVTVARYTDGTFTTLTVPQPPENIPSLPLGSHTFYFRATDINSNMSICSYTITVVDAQAPSFGSTCPPNQTVAADMNGCTKTVTWTVPTATDNCTVNYTPTATLTGGNTSTASVSGTTGMPVSAVFNEGITTVTYTASDNASPANTVSCSFTVKVTNTIPPNITCPVSPVVVPAGANCLYTLGNPGATSSATAPCDPGTITYRLASNNTALTIGLSTFPLGTHTLRAVATDASGNTANCTFNIQVTDQTGPTLQAGSCPANITVNSDVAAICGANVTWSAPVWTDNCNNAGIVISRSAAPVNMATPNTATLLPSNGGGYFPVGVTQVNFTAKDGPAITANIGTPCGFTVTVIDDDLPVLSNCPTSPVVLTATDYPACNNDYTLPVPTVSDYGCNNALPVSYSTTGALVTSTTPLTPSVTLPLGTTVITYSATDGAGNRGTCSFAVQVRDLTGPAFSCPSSQIVVLTSGCSGPATNWADPSVFTDCSGLQPINAPVVVNTTGIPAPSLNGTAMARNGVFPVGLTTLRYVANDNAGNSSSCTFTIDVRENTAPVITCPASQVIAANAGCNANVTLSMLTTPTATDNCGVPQVNLVSPSLPSIQTGTFVVLWQATDASGNSANCSTNVTIQDQTPPTLTCGTFTVQVNVPGNNFIASTAPSFVPQTLISVSDNCASLSLVNVVANPPVLPQYPVGTSFIYWQVTDGVATSTCSQTIVVTPNPTSCTPTTPSFSGGSNCGSTTPVVLPNANCPTTVTVTAAQLGLSATDNCGTPLTLANQNVNVSVSGNQTVTFTATVGSNTATCTRTVSITCNSGPCTPTAVPTFAGCGGTLAVNANASCQGVVTNFGVTASDNCGSRVVTASNNGPFPLGNTTVIFTASNTVGANTCSKIIAVSDITPPTFTSCPADVTIDAEPGEEFALSINLEAPTASDNCSVSSVVLAQGTPELLFGDGEVVTWVATDGSNNPIECQQNVTVIIGNGGGSQACTDALGIELATDGAAGDWYGNSVDVDGSRAIVGAPYDDNGKGTNSGAAYILEKDISGNWTQVAKLIVPDGDADDLFGNSVAIDGNLVIVGANKYAGKGAAFIFSGSGATWTLAKKLIASDGAANDDYGISVDITGTHAIVGADLDDVETKVDQGSVYIYSAATSWGGEVKRIASDGGTNDNFGISVALDGTNAVVGSRYDDDFGVNSGAAYILSKDQGGVNNWGQATKLTASDASAGDYFGSSVAISGNQVIVGSYLDDYSLINNAGSAYVFQGSGASWPEVAKLVPADAAASDQFGSSVSIEAGIALVGSQFDDDMGTNSGSAYVFTEGSGWAQVNKLTGTSVAANDNFGHSVAIGGNSIVIGAYKDDVGAALDQGSAYFFGCTNTPQRPATQEREGVVSGGQVRCFPNPSTDMVNIDVTLNTEETVQVFVSDVTGKLVTTLFDGKMSGENRLQWEGKQFGNGMFFIRVQSASLRETVPVVIIR